MPRKPTRPGPQSPTRIRNVQPKHHDVYDLRVKPPGSLVCDDCRVAYHAGRWSYCSPPAGQVHAGLCPACRRVRDRYPAGTIRLPSTLAEPREEIVNLIRNVAAAQLEEHPLERIIAIDEHEGCLVVTTTGIHLARRIASGLRRRLHAKPTVRYGQDNELCLDWSA